MSALTVDASVWIAAQDPGDVFCQQSRAFLTKAVVNGVVIHVPAYARVEVACALARKLRHAAGGRTLADQILATANVQEAPMDSVLLADAATIGTTTFLRGADALYAATAHRTSSALISWDNEHIQRAGGLTPADWLAANP